MLVVANAGKARRSKLEMTGEGPYRIGRIDDDNGYYVQNLIDQKGRRVDASQLTPYFQRDERLNPVLYPEIKELEVHGAPGTFPEQGDLVIYRTGDYNQGYADKHLRIGKIRQVSPDRKEFTIHRFDGCTVHKQSVKPTLYHTSTNKYRAVYTDKGQEYLQQAEANEATINKTQRRKLRKLSYTAKPVTVRIHRKDILLAFLALGNRETLPPDVKKYLTQTIGQKPM